MLGGWRLAELLLQCEYLLLKQLHSLFLRFCLPLRHCLRHEGLLLEVVELLPLSSHGSLHMHPLLLMLPLRRLKFVVVGSVESLCLVALGNQLAALLFQ